MKKLKKKKLFGYERAHNYHKTSDGGRERKIKKEQEREKLFAYVALA
jgi:hypothetical protein